MFKKIHLSDRYEVDENGTVVSLTGYGGNPKRELKQSISKGYMVVSISLGRTKRVVKVHQLVARAFIANPDKMVGVNHKDGNKMNNHISNLEWCTNPDNIAHAVAHGLRDNKGEQNPKAKLSDKQVREIRRLHRTLNRTQLAANFGVSVSAIERIHYGKAWQHVR